MPSQLFIEVLKRCQVAIVVGALSPPVPYDMYSTAARGMIREARGADTWEERDLALTGTDFSYGLARAHCLERLGPHST